MSAGGLRGFSMYPKGYDLHMEGAIEYGARVVHLRMGNDEGTKDFTLSLSDAECFASAIFREIMRAQGLFMQSGAKGI